MCFRVKTFLLWFRLTNSYLWNDKQKWNMRVICAWIHLTHEHGEFWIRATFEYPNNSIAKKLPNVGNVEIELDDLLLGSNQLKRVSNRIINFNQLTFDNFYLSTEQIYFFVNKMINKECRLSPESTNLKVLKVNKL